MRSKVRISMIISIDQFLAIELRFADILNIYSLFYIFYETEQNNRREKEKKRVYYIILILSICFIIQYESYL